VKRGIREANDHDPFEIFITVTDIRYTYAPVIYLSTIVLTGYSYYKESEKILGNTFGMLVLQDFEAITPNLLARAIETVEGGGLVVLLLKTMTSLRQLYTMTMVRTKLRTFHSVLKLSRTYTHVIEPRRNMTSLPVLTSASFSL
jgi:N-acetyltransferase 10